MRLLTGLLFLVFVGCAVKTPRISTDCIESIDVTVYKHKEDIIGVPDKDFTLTIPKDQWETILAFTLPHKWAEVGTPNLRIGTVRINYRDKKSTSIDLFWWGKNPCLVTLDGKNFYFAKNIPGAPDGSMGLLRKVMDIRKAVTNEKEKKQKKNKQGKGDRKTGKTAGKTGTFRIVWQRHGHQLLL